LGSLHLGPHLHPSKRVQFYVCDVDCACASSQIHFFFCNVTLTARHVSVAPHPHPHPPPRRLLGAEPASATTWVCAVVLAPPAQGTPVYSVRISGAQPCCGCGSRARVATPVALGRNLSSRGPWRGGCNCVHYSALHRGVIQQLSRRRRTAASARVLCRSAPPRGRWPRVDPHCRPTRTDRSVTVWREHVWDVCLLKGRGVDRRRLPQQL
jgi:hypothetical protein